MEIKRADQSHKSTIIHFQKLMAWETEKLQLDEEVLQKGVQAVLNDENKGQYYVAELEHEIIASLLITYEWSDWRNGWVWWIQSVYVLPEARKRGVFKSMYQHLKSQVAQSADIRGLRLYVDKTNTAAQKVYDALGMTDEHYALFEWLK
jgi:ribosomal protein S18 acetylase RimI-like enzyme